MLNRLEAYLSWWNSLSKEGRDQFLRDLRSKKIDNSRRAEIKALAKHFLHKNHVSWSCSSCIMDAHILLVRLKLKDMEKKTLDYVLYPGTILHDPINKDFNLMLMPPRLTEALALYHLAFNPRAKKYFSILPADIESRIADYLSGMTEEMREKALPWALETLTKGKPEKAAKGPTKGKRGLKSAIPETPSEPDLEPVKEPEDPQTSEQPAPETQVEA